MESRTHCEMHLRYPGFKTKALTLSYDDGRDYDRKMVEILDQYGLRCTFNLNSGRLGGEKHVSPEELPELYRNHEVAVHTLTHPHLENLDAANICYQIIEDRKNLEDILHRPIVGMAYPFGLKEYPGLVDAVKNCGIRYARTTAATNGFALPADYLRWNPTCHHSKLQDEQIEKFLEPEVSSPAWRNPAKLLYIWGHSYEYADSWAPLEQMCRKLSGHDEVWYATNGEIIDYISAYRSLRPTVDGHYVYNPTDKAVFVRAGEADVILHPGTTTQL